MKGTRLRVCPSALLFTLMCQYGLGLETETVHRDLLPPGSCVTALQINMFRDTSRWQQSIYSVGATLCERDRNNDFSFFNIVFWLFVLYFDGFISGKPVFMNGFHVFSLFSVATCLSDCGFRLHTEEK